VLHLDQGGELLDAGCAPTRPKVQYDYFALVVVE
jgi:hypothetical protein